VRRWDEKREGWPQPPFTLPASRARQAAFSHIAVSNALLINGIFMPKLAFAAAAALEGFFAPAWLLLVGATSVARSHDPISWERATEKNRNI
jgi:hypothetical protein